MKVRKRQIFTRRCQCQWWICCLPYCVCVSAECRLL